MTPVLRAASLRKSYHEHVVFSGVSLAVARGEVLGVVGPNGAGKTTLLRIVAGLVAASGGDVRVEGEEPRNGVQGLAYFGGAATLPGMVRADTFTALAGGAPLLSDRRLLRLLSRGSRQLVGLRTVLARASVRLLVLDEPWEGLDPDAARWLSHEIHERSRIGCAVVVSSHRLHDLAGVCDQYLFLANRRAVSLRADVIAPAGQVTAAALTRIFDRLRTGCAA